MSDAYELNRIDSILISQLHRDARASWKRLGDAIEVDAQTARRRWATLETRETAWTGAALGPRAAFGVLLDFRPTAVMDDDLADTLCNLPEVILVAESTGTANLVAIAMLPSWKHARRYAQNARRWFTGRLADLRLFIGPLAVSGGLRGVLDSELRPVDRRTTSSGFQRPVDVHDRMLLQVLSVDARIDFGKLAEMAQSSASTVRRRMTLLQRRGEIVLLADSVSQVPRHDREFWVEFSVPSSNVLQSIDQLARWPEVRLVAATTGVTNLVVVLRARSESHTEQLIERLEALAVAYHPVFVRALLHHHKRFARVFDATGDVSRVVPFDPWGSAAGA